MYEYQNRCMKVLVAYICVIYSYSTYDTYVHLHTFKGYTKSFYLKCITVERKHAYHHLVHENPVLEVFKSTRKWPALLQLH